METYTKDKLSANNFCGFSLGESTDIKRPSRAGDPLDEYIYFNTFHSRKIKTFMKDRKRRSGKEGI